MAEDTDKKIPEKVKNSPEFKTFLRLKAKFEPEDTDNEDLEKGEDDKKSPPKKGAEKKEDNKEGDKSPPKKSDSKAPPKKSSAKEDAPKDEGEAPKKKESPKKSPPPKEDSEKKDAPVKDKETPKAPPKKSEKKEAPKEEDSGEKEQPPAKEDPKKNGKKAVGTGEKIIVPKGNTKIDFEPKFDLSPLPMRFEDFCLELMGEDIDMDVLFEFADLLEEAWNEYNGDGLITEILSVSQRIQRKQIMRRYKSRLKIGRKRASARRATTQRITKRARRSALGNLKKRFASGRSINKLSYSERARVEKMASRRKAVVVRNTKRLVRVKRQQERDRLANRGKKK